MNIIFYPHPTLRYKSKPIKRVDKNLKAIVAEMFELMYEARGIGLAANQVNLPLQLFVVNTTGEAGQGEELVFINPVLSQPKGTEAAEEGCLSLPGVNGPVNRPAKIHVSAYDLNGNEIDMTVSGLLGRAIQHECDHLNGVMFIDRLSDNDRKMIAGEIDEFVFDFEQSANRPSESDIKKHWAEIENEYC